MVKFTVGNKLGVGFGAVLLLMLVSAGLTHYKSSSVEEEATRINTLRMPTILAARTLQGDINQLANKARQCILSASDKARFQENRKLYEEQRGHVERDLAAMKELSPRWTVQANRDRLAAITAEMPQFDRLQLQSIELARGNSRDAIVKAGAFYDDKVMKSRAVLKKPLEEMVESQQKLLDDEKKKMTEALTSMNWTVWSFVLTGLAIGGAVAAYLSRTISRAIVAALERAEAIARCDLSGSEIPITTSDEVGGLTLAVNKMQSNLREMILSVTTSAERIATAGEEISASATQQAQGAQTQKDQTHQVATAMQEMSSTVQQVSENSNKAAEASRKAADTAREGGAIVNDTLAKMRAIADSVGQTARKVQELGKSSDQIGQIIGVIDDIADQTNLLALNAAIEAARAGEQGRGFAVVADEVRKLAERTSKATKEITQMIQSIQTETRSAVEAMQAGTKQVEQGVESTTLAGSSLHDIIQVSVNVGDMVMQIATAATEQASATEEINSNIEQIAKITQETAVGANQSAKAVHELSSLATELQSLVGRFNVGNGNGNGAHGRRVAKSRLAGNGQARTRGEAQRSETASA